MASKYACRHMDSIVKVPIASVISHRTLVCEDCDCVGPNLWICLHKHCLRIGCSEGFNDHSTSHNEAEPSHCIHFNLSSRRFWCYECKSEVFVDQVKSVTYNDSDQEGDNCQYRSHDSGHGSYSTLRTNSPEHVNDVVFGDGSSGNVGMNGDTSESSDGEESSDYNIEKPQGLVGLQNIGNTCYMNAALQALSNTVPLTRFFLECTAAVQLLSEGRKPGLSRTYQALMRDIWMKKNGGYVTPSGILYGIRSVHVMFRGYHQHDTQEFLRNFMDQLHEELKQLQAPEQNVGSDVDTFCMAMEEPTLSSSYDSSEGEYETCDSGVSERSSLSDDTERPSGTSKRRISRSASPGRRLRVRYQNNGVVDSQPSTSNSQANSSINKKQTKYRSIISDIFDGKLLSSVQCLTCDRVSSRVETFQDLSLPIPSRDHLVVLHGRSSTPSATCSEAVIPVEDGWITWILAWLRSWFYGPMVTLHDCLAAFFSTDELKGDNMYSCEKCNKLRNGIKFSKVLQLPEILCIHLKRFRHELMFSSKISSVVSFPLKGLEMKPYLHSDCVSKVTSYELYSVICHHGTAGGGHYICYSLNGNQWYEFDDQYVTRVSADKVQTCEAYVLFYRKVSYEAEEIRNEIFELVDENIDTPEVAYVSRQWLSRFTTCAEPGPIDNSDFLCQHGSVSPERVHILEQLTAIIPLVAYKYLLKKFGGSPAITTITVCPACQALQKRILVERETFLQLSTEAQELNLPATHFLSTSWYGLWHNFVQRRTLDPPGPIDNSKINVHQLDINECAEITENIWNFFNNIYGGGPELRIKLDIQRTESETSLQSEAEDVPDFIIPTLKKKQESVDAIDRTMYSHGEPAEAKVIENGVVDNENKGEQVDMVTCDDASEVKPNNTNTNNNLSNNNHNNLNNSRSSKVESSNKQRRRRRQAVDYS